MYNSPKLIYMYQAFSALSKKNYSNVVH